MKSVLLAYYLVTFVFLNAKSDEWNYPTPGSNGVMSEPESWGGQCDNGRRQSPIDLAQAAAVRGEFAPFFFSNYKLPIRQAQLANTGHSLQISNQDPAVTIQGGGLGGRFVLDQMHFHWGSEHTIDSTRYGLELHLVHHDTRYTSLDEAAAARNGVAVLGVLFHVSAQPNMHIDVILNTAADIRNQAGAETSLKGKLAPHFLMPANRSAFYRYEGSLTTPACAESVIWTVFTDSVGVSLEQIEQFKAIHDQNGKELLNNFRSVQPLNARALVYATEWDRQGNNFATVPRLHALLIVLMGLLIATSRVKY
ncbi:carbonic anhydrase isoform X2 [Anopheles funestus]|uniref:Carbonic anhydrase n=1 Tax=Anopheles funestus TaxID=62324 RepID=A0A182RVN7_ANOFN|nr:carbonic anhydrase isoform X2 [Anopheles funestus]XP_049300266.1 carbonic anhydrase isoform X2 [Anopheles funestus]